MRKIILVTLCILMSLVSAQAKDEFRLILGTDAVTVIPDDNTKTWCLIAVTEKNSQQLWKSSVDQANMKKLGFTSPTPECIYTWKVWANDTQDKINKSRGFVNPKFGQLTLNYDNIAILNDRDYKGEQFTFVIAYVQKTTETLGYEITSDLTMQDLTYDPGFTFHPNWYTNSEDSNFFFNPNDQNVEYWYTVINEKNRKDSTDQQIWERAANPTSFLGITINDITPLKGYNEYISLAGYKGGDHSVIFAGIETKTSGLRTTRVPKGEVHRFTFTPDADRVKEEHKDTVIVVPPSAVKDTMEFTTTNVMPEISDNEGKYIYGILSMDGKWMTQINYNAASRYGHITEKEFNLAGEGKNYNFIKNAKNDMEFYLFKNLEATVTEGGDGETIIEINGLINPDSFHKDVFRRVLIHATLPAYSPTDTINIDMGHAYVSYNEYVSLQAGINYYSIEAYSKDYTLVSGFFAKNLDDATYLTRDLVKPYLIHKGTGLTVDTISLCAPCEHVLRVSHQADVHQFVYDIISEDLHLYHITFDDKVETVVPTDTVIIQCYNTQATDASDLYGVYTYFGENNTYQVTIAVNKSAVDNKNTVYSNSDINFNYSLVFNSKTEAKILLNSATATLVDNGDQTYDLRADLIGRDQILYKVAMPIGYSVLPEDADTIDIHMNLGRIDYATGVAGAVGIVGYNPESELHIYFFNSGSLEGKFAEDRFFYQSYSYLTRITDGSARFTDIMWANADMTKEGDDTHMTFLVYTITNEMLRIHIDMPKLEFMTQEKYSIDMADDVVMVAVRDTVFRNGDAIFTLQFQYAEDFDEEDFPIGNQRYFNYQLISHDSLSIAGKYGYNDTTLNMDRWHTLVEQDIELYIGPMAGTLEIIPERKLALNLYGQRYETNLYTITSSFVGENGTLYELTGQNVLFAIDTEGNLLTLKEFEDEGFEITDAEGNIVKKQIINGHLYIELNGRRYTVLGQ